MSKGIAEVPPAIIAESVFDALSDKKLAFAFVSLILNATTASPLFVIDNLFVGAIFPIPTFPPDVILNLSNAVPVVVCGTVKKRISDPPIPVVLAPKATMSNTLKLLAAVL